MNEYIVEISKYIIILCMALYTFECFLVFSLRPERRKGVYTRQTILIFLIQIICFFDLVYETKDINFIFLYLFIQVFFFATIALYMMIYENVDRLLLNNMCMLLGIGFIMLSRLSFHKAFRQFVIAFASMAVAIFIPYLIQKMTFLKKLTWLYAAVGFFMLSVVLILGEVIYGSKIAFTIAGITFQPSEVVKIIFVFFLAGALWENTSVKRVLLVTIISAIHILVLVVSKDLGSALIFFVAFLSIIFIATKNYWYLLIGLLSGSAAAVIAYTLFSHVRIRVLAWNDPWSYIDSQGYQITQSLFAISSGNWFGLGLFQGSPMSIPLVEADFIFSAVCEELGVITGICIILICLSCFISMMDIAANFKDNFYKLVAFGCGIIYLFQIFLTVGGGIKFIPLTGVTLPFISYGGSSVLTTIIMFGIMQGITVMNTVNAQKSTKIYNKNTV